MHCWQELAVQLCQQLLPADSCSRAWLQHCLQLHAKPRLPARPGNDMTASHPATSPDAMDLLGLLLTLDRHPLWPSTVRGIERWLHALTEPTAQHSTSWSHTSTLFVGGAALPKWCICTLLLPRRASLPHDTASNTLQQLLCASRQTCPVGVSMCGRVHTIAMHICCKGHCPGNVVLLPCY
jgi:hypothetical protein